MSLSLNNSTIVPLLSGEIFLGKEYDNILDFAEIDIAIKCDVGYTLTYIYSQDKLSIDYSTNQTVSAHVNTQFYKLPVNDRYFKLKIEATDGDMSVLNVQTIYKSVPTFNNSGAGPTSNVAITAPLNGDGSVFVGGSLTLGGSVDANITNTSLDVNVLNPVNSVDANITNASLNVDVGNFPASQTVNGSVDANITNASLDVNVGNFPAVQNVNLTNASVVVSGSIDVNNFPASQTVNGSVDANITNASLDVNVGNFPVVQDVNLTNASLDVNVLNPVNSVDANITNASLNVDVGNFPASQTVNGSVDANITNASLDVNVGNFPAVQNVNLTNASLDVNVLNPVNSVDANITNASLNVNVGNFPLVQAISNGSLSSMSFDTNRLNVYDSDTNTKLTNIYNVVNSKGAGTLWNNVNTGANGLSDSIDLSNKKVSNLTFMGNCNGATLLTVQFSSDNTNYFDSQYSYNLTGAGDVGFNLSGCPNYLRMKSSNDVVATLLVNYC